MGLFAALKGYFKGKESSYYRDEKEIHQKVRGYAYEVNKEPSWHREGNGIDVFCESVSKLLSHRGIEEDFFMKLLLITPYKDRLINCAAEMEERGHSFAEQQLSVVNLIEIYYNDAVESDAINIVYGGYLEEFKRKNKHRLNNLG